MQLADDEARKLMLKRFESHGISEERIELHGGLIPRDDHVNFYSNVDVGLDPFPYNGTTTTCEALSMGVPVICLDGDTHRARVGVSLLSQVGLTELIADTVDDYVRLAVDLGRDPHYLTELRASLRNRLGSSPLMDAHATTKELEKAYRTMWRTYCQQPVESNSDREDSDFLRLHIGGSEPKPGWKI
jgi:predicted O-linked N-acetylglucosamine transferase (SPINDLY family)